MSNRKPMTPEEKARRKAKKEAKRKAYELQAKKHKKK